MLKHFFGGIFNRKHCWFDALVNVTLTVGWWQHNNARVSFLREAIYTIVIVLVIHPEVETFKKSVFGLAKVPRKH